MESTDRHEMALDSDQDGFTLIEIIVVLAIISLVMALVIPIVGGPPGKYALPATAHDVATALRLARDKAVSENRITHFVADARALNLGDDRHLRQVPSGVTLAFLARDRPKSPQPRGTISFYPDGSSTGGRFILTAGAANSAIFVNWFDGDVSVQIETAPSRH